MIKNLKSVESKVRIKEGRVKEKNKERKTEGKRSMADIKERRKNDKKKKLCMK